MKYIMFRVVPFTSELGNGYPLCGMLLVCYQKMSILETFLRLISNHISRVSGQTKSVKLVVNYLTLRSHLVLVAFVFANTDIFFSSAKASVPKIIQLGNTTFQCSPSIVKPIDKIYNGEWSFNKELAAGVYGIYAAASYDAYEPRPSGISRAFHIADNDPVLNSAYGKTGWFRVEPRHENLSGLSYDVYYHDTPERLDVMIAYRGTDDARDWIANLSWVTKWLNPWDQYRQARNEYEDVMERAVKTANGKPIAFVATGHSLGGGLAQHVANTHPCSSAVVFDTSFVTNSMGYGNLNPTVVKLYEKEDIFENLAFKINNTDTRAIYRFKLISAKGAIYNHDMEKFAAGILRMAIECKRKSSVCEVPNPQAVVSSTLFCDRYIKLRYDLGDRNALKMKEKLSLCPSHRYLH